MLKLKTLYIYTKNDIIETSKKIIKSDIAHVILILLFLLFVVLFAIASVVVFMNIFVNILNLLYIVEFPLPVCQKERDRFCDIIESRIPMKCLLVLFDIFVFILFHEMKTSFIQIKTIILYFVLNLLFLFFLNVDKITLYLHIFVTAINCLFLLFYFVPKQIKNIKKEIRCIEDGLIEVVIAEQHKKEDDNLISKYFLLQ